jgi:lysophospholipase
VTPDIRQARTDFDRRAIPPVAAEGHWTAADGHAVRRIDWPAPEQTRGSLLFLPGRSDFYEKYLETLDHWYRRGWAVTSIDWRGQAGSGRLGLDETTGHIGDFSQWVGDLGDFWKEWKSERPGPHVLVAHSMGGHLALRAMAEGRADPAAAVLTAPMLGLIPGLGIIPVSWLHSYARFMASRGDPRRSAWQGSERPRWNPVDRFTRLTHDAARYEDEAWWKEERPELAMGAPSWGWIEAALRSSRLLGEPGVLEAIAVPVLIVATTADRLVDFAAIRDAARRLPDCRLDVFGAEARHELLREEDAVRDRVLDLIDGFIESRTGVPD